MDREDWLKKILSFETEVSQTSDTSRLTTENDLEKILSEENVQQLETFPSVFFSLLKEKKEIDWEAKGWDPKKIFSDEICERLSILLSLSSLLFDLFAIEPAIRERTASLLKLVGDSTSNLKDAFFQSASIQVGTLELSTENIKTNFREQLTATPKEEMHQKQVALQGLISELFTDKQKEILRKRLLNESMSKTEKEYFYRVVKKRLKALASEDIHLMAKELLGV